MSKGVEWALEIPVCKAADSVECTARVGQSGLNQQDIQAGRWQGAGYGRDDKCPWALRAAFREGAGGERCETL